MNTKPPAPSYVNWREELGIPPYDAGAAELAWERLFTFFVKHLKSK
jgi:dienelactone hydrolase|tara:strand:- start:429 stop:566 length:138 start_codon:yes stop_codon:yes gene_type:complete